MENNGDTEHSSDHLDFVGGLVIGAAVSVALICFASGFRLAPDWWGAADKIFSSYGSILAGAGATIAAMLTIAAIRQQIASQQKQFEDEKRSRILEGYTARANELQAGALEMLSAVTTLQLRYSILKKLFELGHGHVKLTENQMADFPQPPPLTSLTRTAMAHLRGSTASRALSYVDQIARGVIRGPLEVGVALKQTELALINSSEAYLYLSAMSSSYDTLSKGRKRGKVVIEGEEFFLHFEEIAADGGIDLDLIETCYQRHSIKPFWRAGKMADEGFD
ncbi:MAG: hypothetical protein H5U13_07895 [Parvibaculum sp.]|nr:hypothetical protein [Parvibaculum sp.]